MAAWDYQLNGDEFEQTLGDSEGQAGVQQSMGLQIVGETMETDDRLYFLALQNL